MDSDHIPLKQWTITHGFCAVMGGFVIDMDESCKAYFQTGVSSPLILSAEAILLLAECEPQLLAKVSQDSILDRGKADNLSKILVCVQTGWMVLQCVARVASRLPLTLLELNTLGHVACGIMLYMIWFKKPQDMSEAIVLKGEHIQSWGAFFSLSSDRVDFEKAKPELIWGNSSRLHLGKASQATTTSPNPAALSPRFRSRLYSGSWEKNLGNNPSSQSRHKLLSHDKWLELTGFGSTLYNEPFHKFQKPLISIDRLALDCILRYPAVLGLSLKDGLNPRYVLPEATNWIGESSLRRIHRHNIKRWLLLSLASCIFGGLHLFAWESSFVSQTEQGLWRVSALYITSMGALAGVYVIANEIIELQKFCAPFFVLRFVYEACISVLPLCYLGARIFLIVEAFISLRDLPVEAYQTPNWTQLIPHF